MKLKYVKIAWVVGVSCMSLGSARAEDPAPVAVSLDVPVLSAYVWRGQVLNDEIVIEPSLTVSKNGFSLNAWANFNGAGSYSGDNNSKFSEVDLTASYTHSAGPASLGVGVVQYLFPNQTLTVTDGTETTGKAYPGTYEVYITAGFPGIPLAPALTIYRDLDAIEGFYGVLSVSQSFSLHEKVSLVAFASLGAGDKKYNNGYFGDDEAALNDANVGLSLPIALTSSLTIKPSASYTCLPDSTLRDAAEAVYGNKDQFVGSITASYAF
ncbi:MAG: TorF family putative porin [Lentisphaerota bacterium]